MRLPVPHTYLALAVLTGLLGLVGAPSVADPVAATTSAAQARGYAIDNGDKSAVRDAYRSRFKDNVEVESGWLGSTLLCVAGSMSGEAEDAVLESINFVRAMAGLDAVGWADGLSAKSQQAALLMDANDQLSHDPPQSWDCWTQDAAEAAGHSNLAITTGTMGAGESIELYMDDPGANNKVVGHRRWLLRPEATKFGVGMTDTVSAVWVLGPTKSGRSDPRWVPWPTAGWFPAGLQPRGRWSLSAGPRADFSKAVVVVRTTDGKRLDVTKYKPVNGYGRPTLVFKVAGLERNGRYVATVRGVKGMPTARHTWKVKLFG